MQGHSDSRSGGVVRTAVIPAAGHGTRMLPATKAVPKELLPILEVPALQLIIDEAAGAGVEHLVVVTSPFKPAIAEYLEPSEQTESTLRQLGRSDLADRLHRTGHEIEVTLVVQERALGLGHAVACARDAVRGEPFFVMLPDELMGGSHLLRSMADAHVEHGCSVIAVQRMATENLSRYGVVAPRLGASLHGSAESTVDDHDDLVVFDDVVEKPELGRAPSDLAIIGRYLLTNDIFDHLSRVRPGANGEIQLTDALAAQAHSSASIALVTSIARRDIGYPLGWMQAVVESALRDPHAGPQVRRILNELLRSSIDD